MPDTVICAPVRTAVGRYGGMFKDMQAASLGAAVISAVVKRTGISLGHPVGATGGRILATLLHELTRREQRYGLETMCIGGEQGTGGPVRARCLRQP